MHSEEEADPAASASTRVDDVEIILVEDDSPVIAQLYEGLDERHLLDHEQQWRPILLEAAHDAVRRCTRADGTVDETRLDTEIVRLQLQDCLWRWREKSIARRQLPEFTAFALECEGHAQGLMYVKEVMRGCRLKSQAGAGYNYVDLVATAPWNRTPLTAKPRFRAVGPVMIATAISLSYEQGYDGRIGLHSLPQAETFYRDKCGMTDCGRDSSKEDLVYFEMTPTQAQAFLNHSRRGGR